MKAERFAVSVVLLGSLIVVGCSTHKLGIYSEPDGAEILINGDSIGETTPAEIQIKDLEYGTHIISVEKPGYELGSRPQEVRIGFRRGLAVNSVLFFWTPFPWVRMYQTGFKGMTYPRGRRIPVFYLDEIEEPKTGGPLSFEAAVKMASRKLFDQVSRHSRYSPGGAVKQVVADPVVDANTGEVTVASARIQRVMESEVRREFPRLALAEMNSSNIDSADYVLSGIVPLEPYGRGGQKLRHLLLSVFDRRSGKVVAHSDAWIADPDVSFGATPMYADSPMYLKDGRVDALIATARAQAGEIANKEYFDSLATNALLTEASKAYDEGEYQLALGLFSRAAERADGRVMKTFSGLYQTFFKLDLYEDAERAFSVLADMGMRGGNLGVKFLFTVDATEFYGSARDLFEYDIWLRQIAALIAASPNCVEVVGHSSNTGPPGYNLDLSLRRAALVRRELQRAVPAVNKKTTAIGRGFAENIVGTGTDDENDKIDRRVEFRLARCEF